jgi:hypothetical protein
VIWVDKNRAGIRAAEEILSLGRESYSSMYQRLVDCTATAFADIELLDTLFLAL